MRSRFVVHVGRALGVLNHQIESLRRLFLYATRDWNSSIDGVGNVIEFRKGRAENEEDERNGLDKKSTKTHSRDIFFSHSNTKLTGTKLRRPFRSRFRDYRRFLLLCGEQKQRRQVGRVDIVRLLVEPEEVHSRNEDGLCGVEEAARQSGFDRVFERVHEIIRFSSPLCVFYSPNTTIFNLIFYAHPFFNCSSFFLPSFFPPIFSSIFSSISRRSLYFRR